MKIDITFKDGVTLPTPEITVTRPDQLPRFIISIRKSGSTMLTHLSEMIANETGFGFFNVGDWLFTNNVKPWILQEEDSANPIIQNGIFFSGFRDYPAMFEKSDLYRNSPKVFLIRDPRDALVSEYFSMRKTHSVPESGGGNTDMMLSLRQRATVGDINDLIRLRARSFANTAAQFFPTIQAGKSVVLKYEDIIFDKVSFVNQVCAALQVQVSAQKVAEFAKIIDQRPAQENPDNFVRKVTPGDYKEKLRPDTIANLNATLKQALEVFGYPP